MQHSEGQKYKIKPNRSQLSGQRTIGGVRVQLDPDTSHVKHSHRVHTASNNASPRCCKQLKVAASPEQTFRTSPGFVPHWETRRTETSFVFVSKKKWNNPDKCLHTNAAGVSNEMVVFQKLDRLTPPTTLSSGSLKVTRRTKSLIARAAGQLFWVRAQACPRSIPRTEARDGRQLKTYRGERARGLSVPS